MCKESERPARILVVELWGIGDAVMMSAFLRSLPEERGDITVLCKPLTVELLQPSYPHVSFIAWDAPWTAFKGKYHLWRWQWRALFCIIRSLRSRRFDIAVSVRKDPRDAFLMWLVGARRRCGFTYRGSGIFLNRSLALPYKNTHRVEDWWSLAELVLGESLDRLEPYLDGSKYRYSASDPWVAKSMNRPRWLVHCGGGQKMKRWPEEYFVALMKALRKSYDFSLAVMLDPDGCGHAVANIADISFEPKSIAEMVQCIESADILFANDSGPGHVAGALQLNVVTIFGSALPEWYRPYTKRCHVVKLYPPPCGPKYSSGGKKERRCLTELKPEMVSDAVQPFLARLYG